MLMMGRVMVANYLEPHNLLVNVQINNNVIPNTLINLSISINVMTCETIKGLGFFGLRQTLAFLQRAHKSMIK